MISQEKIKVAITKRRHLETEFDNRKAQLDTEIHELDVLISLEEVSWTVVHLVLKTENGGQRGIIFNSPEQLRQFFIKGAEALK